MVFHPALQAAWLQNDSELYNNWKKMCLVCALCRIPVASLKYDHCLIMHVLNTKLCLYTDNHQDRVQADKKKRKAKGVTWWS